MTAPLRRRHLAVWIALGIALAAIFSFGLRDRRSATPPNAGLHWEKMR